MLNVIMMLMQDRPSPSLNENLSITVDRLIYPYQTIHIYL